MSREYFGRSVWKYFSELAPHRDFETPELARRFDFDCAIETIFALGPDYFRKVHKGEPQLAAALRVLADEVEEGRTHRLAHLPAAAEVDLPEILPRRAETGAA